MLRYPVSMTTEGGHVLVDFLDQLEQALAAVGKRLELHVVEEAARVR